MGFGRELLTRILIRAMTLKGRLDLRDMHRNAEKARKVNDQLLFKILKKNQNCLYGRQNHFDQIHTVEDFRRLVPMTTFSDYAPYIERMVQNDEKGLITSLPLVGYAQSSGSTGKRKYIPLTAPEVKVYTKYTVTRMLAATDRYYRQKTGKGFRPGRGLFDGPTLEERLPNGLPCSNIADVAALRLGFLYPYIIGIPFRKLFTPAQIDFQYINSRFAFEDPNTLYMFGVFIKTFTELVHYWEVNWRTIVDDIEHGTISDLAHATPETKEKLMTVIKPNPQRAAELRREFEKGFDNTLLRRLWPHFAVACYIGTSSFTPFTKIARKTTGDIPLDFSIYGASEGLFAAVDELESQEQLMLPDSCYYEFIPQDDESKILSIDQLEVGKDYEVVITNQAGLYRYRFGDVIRVTGYRGQCPYIRFGYRKGQLLNVTGEKTSEEHMAAVVKKIGQAAGCALSNWAVAVDLDAHPCRYVLLVENDKGLDLREYTDLAEEALRQANIRYQIYAGIWIGPLRIVNQRPGTHQAWNEAQVTKGVSASQVKPVRILDTPEKEAFFLSRLVDQETFGNLLEGENT